VLRPETCQGIFVNMPAVQRAQRLRLPFGLAQVGRAYRNELNPGDFLFRTREFEQMELEYFTDPDDPESPALAHVDAFADEALSWLTECGIRAERLRKVEVARDDLAHYASRCIDIEYEYPFGWREIAGIAHRGSHDIERHAAASGTAMDIEDLAVPGRRVTPVVTEPSFGLDRVVLALLCEAMESRHTTEDRFVLGLHPDLAPVRVAVLPLRKALHGAAARDLRTVLLRAGLDADYDEAGSVGRRYRRQDELGTPFVVTVDDTTLADGTVTVRERDSMDQRRVRTEDVAAQVAPSLFMRV
jgi:glycyl-tRNA synthetase